MKISVAMAYYNGGKYIRQQMESILSQLKKEDELIISVDGAADGSDKLLKEWAAEDCRIQLIDGPGKGVVRNFENALTHCKGDIIFLSDQDDVWMEDKVKKILKGFERSNVLLILHNGILIDDKGQELEGETLFEIRNSGTGVWKNFIKNSYIGCCMAFRKELLPVIIPIPEKMYMHDYWIGAAAEYMGRGALIKEPLIGYRRHGENVTQMQHGSLSFMLKKRMDILRCIKILKHRVKQVKKYENN